MRGEWKNLDLEKPEINKFYLIAYERDVEFYLDSVLKTRKLWSQWVAIYSGTESFYVTFLGDIGEIVEGPIYWMELPSNPGE